MITIFDKRIVIKGKGDDPDILNQALDRLSAMLNAYEISHWFAYPDDKIVEKTPDACAVLYIRQKDEFVVTLMHILVEKLYREESKTETAKALVYFAKHYIPVHEDGEDTNGGN